MVLSTSGAKARKSSDRTSWDWFYRLLEPRPESHQIEPPGTGFINFWNQDQKVSKSSLLGLVLSTSGAEARKPSNQASWTGFVNSWHLKGAGGETVHPNCQRIQITETQYYRLRSSIEAPLQPFASFLRCCYRYHTSKAEN